MCLSPSFNIYRPQRSCGQGYVFTRVCDSVHRGGVSGQGEPPQPGQGEPPQSRHPPPGKHTPAYGQRAAGTHPTGMHSCPPGKHTPAYGQRVAGTHPTGMHSCWTYVLHFF